MYQGKKIVVIMPAYNAAKTLVRTFNDLPRDIVDNVVLVDDASSDATIEVARTLPIHVVEHQYNTGYGGNQKTCYREALKLGADIVIMVHPDHQYDPKFIPEMLRVMQEKNVSAVFGSRMRHWHDALAGGMPWWKFGFNILLTQMANLMLGTKLTEIHSGFRAYRADVFRHIDISKNSDDFVFDTEIIIQLVDANIPIAEIPISTRYFPEASQIGFMRSIVYGWGVLWNVIAYRLGLMSLRGVRQLADDETIQQK